MSLNIRKGDMYKFIDFTWNPIKGKCLHDCSYCYMKQINPKCQSAKTGRARTQYISWLWQVYLYRQFHRYVRRKYTIRMD